MVIPITLINYLSIMSTVENAKRVQLKNTKTVGCFIHIMDDTGSKGISTTMTKELACGVWVYF